MAYAICYKTTKPLIINKGTKDQIICDEFLAYYCNKSKEEAEREANELNTNKPERLFNGELALCDERTYYVNEQEEMY